MASEHAHCSYTRGEKRKQEEPCALTNLDRRLSTCSVWHIREQQIYRQCRRHAQACVEQ